MALPFQAIDIFRPLISIEFGSDVFGTSRKPRDGVLTVDTPHLRKIRVSRIHIHGTEIGPKRRGQPHVSV